MQPSVLGWAAVVVHLESLGHQLPGGPVLACSVHSPRSSQSTRSLTDAFTHCLLCVLTADVVCQSLRADKWSCQLLCPHLGSILPCFFLKQDIWDADFFKRILCIYCLRGGEGGRKKGRETLMWPGTKPETQACAVMGNWTGDFLLCGTTPNQRSLTGHGKFAFFKARKIKLS